MAHELRIALWVTEDGTWGKGPILLVDDATWSQEQNKWFDKHIDEYGEPDIDVVTDIDINVEPEWEEE